MTAQISISKKLELIENEIGNLKAMMIKLTQNKGKMSVIKLEGLINGMNVSEKDIENAKKSVFKNSSL